MHIEQLHYFLQVAESGSVNAAAQKFYRTPQAINASLRKLEAEFDSPLLKRSKKGVTLTPQGHVFVAYAKEVIEKNEKMHWLLRAYNAKDISLSGTLSVFTASIFADTILPVSVHNFTQIFPQTNIKIMQVNSADILHHFSNNYCDIVLLTANKPSLDSFIATHCNDRIKMIPLLLDSIVICARANHPLMRHTFLSADDLTNHITKTNQSISFFHMLFLDSDGMHYPKAISSSNSIELHKKLMAENNTMTVMPKMAYHTSFQEDRFAAVPLGVENNTIHALLYKENPTHEHYDLTTRFINALQKQFERHYGIYEEK